MAIKNSVSIDFDLRSSIVLTFSIATYPVRTCTCKMGVQNLEPNAPRRANIGPPAKRFAGGPIVARDCACWASIINSDQFLKF